MPGSFSDFMENAIIDAVFRNQAFPTLGTLYIALFTTNDNDADSAAVEVSGGSYARVAVASSLANWAGTQGAGTTASSSGTGGATSNNNNITFPSPTGNWGTIVGVGVYDAASGGHLIVYGSLTNSKNVNNGDAAPYFPPGSFVFTVD